MHQLWNISDWWYFFLNGRNVNTQNVHSIGSTGSSQHEASRAHMEHTMKICTFREESCGRWAEQLCTALHNEGPPPLQKNDQHLEVLEWALLKVATYNHNRILSFKYSCCTKMTRLLRSTTNTGTSASDPLWVAELLYFILSACPASVLGLRVSLGCVWQTYCSQGGRRAAYTGVPPSTQHWSQCSAVSIPHIENLAACCMPSTIKTSSVWLLLWSARCTGSGQHKMENKRKPKAWHRNQTSNLPNNQTHQCCILPCCSGVWMFSVCSKNYWALLQLELQIYCLWWALPYCTAPAAPDLRLPHKVCVSIISIWAWWKMHFRATFS